MEILKVDKCLDGGTIVLRTNEGDFWIDNRIRSNTKGEWFNGYPKEDNSNLIEDSEELEERLIKALSEFKDGFYKESINSLIESKRKPK
jgi:hypothetical protein